jgi:hypothetical protein
MSIGAANQECLRRIQDSQPVLVDLRPAIEVIPGMTERSVLHAGPPVTWEHMCGPMRGAITGACLHEGWAKTPEAAVALAESGELAFASCHDRGAAGPMSGIITPSMYVYVVRNQTFGNEAYSGLYEGIGKVLRHGAYDEAVLERLAWMNRDLAPVLAAAIRRSGGIDIKTLIAEALQMGDEMHNRNKASSSRFVLALVPHLVALGKGDLERIISFMDSSGHYSLNPVMASCKATLDAAAGIADSTLVTVMARNGTEFGLRVSALGDRWFTAPSRATGPRTPIRTWATRRSPRPRGWGRWPWPGRRPWCSSSAAPPSSPPRPPCACTRSPPASTRPSKCRTWISAACPSASISARWWRPGSPR